MNTPKLSKAGERLRTEINKQYPNRKKDSDGWIGDKKHNTQKSDHNPDKLTGIVRAIDIDSDLGKDIDSWELAEAIRQAGKNGDKRISYIIHRGKIANGKIGLWIWRPYNGQNRHDTHIHISFTKDGDKDNSKFNITYPIKKKENKTEKLCENCKNILKKYI